MDRTYWSRQAADRPLFPDLIWSRPENKRWAGKLLVLGGNLHGFSAAATAYNAAAQAGVGTARVILPASLQKTLAKVFPEADYAPSNVSGSFARASLADWLEQAAWADSVLLAGDFGNNSETSALVESFLDKYDGQVTLAGDAIDFFLKTPAGLLDRFDTSLVVSFGQLQKLAAASGFTPAFTSQMDLLHLVEALHDLSIAAAGHFQLEYGGQLIVAVNGQISTTKLDQTPSTSQLAAQGAVWWLQNPSKPFEALTTSLVAN